MESDICCCCFFFPSHPFSKHVIPLFFIFPSKWCRCWNTDICAVRGAFCLSHSLSLGVQLRGLVCAWVPRIMITAAEKHILTFQEIRAGNLQAEDLTSSLWLIVELTEKSPPTTGLHRALCTSRKNTHYYLLHCKGHKSLWNDTEITFTKFSNSEVPWLTMSPLHYCPISYCGG